MLARDACAAILSFVLIINDILFSVAYDYENSLRYTYFYVVLCNGSGLLDLLMYVRQHIVHIVWFENQYRTIYVGIIIIRGSDVLEKPCETDSPWNNDRPSPFRLLAA